MNVGKRSTLTLAQTRTIEQRAAIAAAVASDPEERVVKMPELRFLQNRFGWEPKPEVKR